MKKLLVATSALVAAAGSAAALDVSLGGNISITAELDVDNSGFNGADWGAGFTMKASGESMGWTYGGTLKFGMFTAIADSDSDTDGFQLDPTLVNADGSLQSGHLNAMALQISSASVYMGGDFMGKVAVQDSCGNYVKPSKVDATVGSVAGNHCINWTGLEVGGVEVMAALALDSLASGDSGLIIGAKGDIMGASFAAEYDLETEDYEATVDLDMGGIALGMDMSWDEGATDEFDYSVSAGTTMGDLSITVDYSPENRLGVKTANGVVVATANDEYGYTAGGAAGALTGEADKSGKDIMATIKYGSCWTASLGYDPVDDFNGGEAWESDTLAAFNSAGGDEEVAGDMTGLYMWSVGYACDLHDGVNISASIGQDEVAATTELGGMKGKVGAKVTF